MIFFVPNKCSTLANFIVSLCSFIFFWQNLNSTGISSLSIFFCFSLSSVVALRRISPRFSTGSSSGISLTFAMISPNSIPRLERIITWSPLLMELNVAIKSEVFLKTPYRTVKICRMEVY